MSVTTSLPRTPEDISASWLEASLGTANVKSVELDGVIRGSTTKVFVRVESDGPADLPDTLCIKGAFDEPRAAVSVLGAQQEARFFGALAPTLDIPLFRTWFTGTDDHQGVVVFDDLRGTGTRFTPVGEALSPDLVARALEVQAGWHAATWAFPSDGHAWLPVGNHVLATAGEALFAEEHFYAHVADPATVSVPDELADPVRMRSAIHRLFELQADEAHALSHGDAHVGNTYLDADGQPGFYDWQTFCLAPCLDDVSYFIAGALDVDARRERERDLLDHYLTALAGAGGPRLDRDTAWLDYRRYQVHGFFWAVLPTAWQPVQASVPMAERYIAAILDHDTLVLLDA